MRSFDSFLPLTARNSADVAFPKTTAESLPSCLRKASVNGFAMKSAASAGNAQSAAFWKTGSTDLSAGTPPSDRTASLISLKVRLRNVRKMLNRDRTVLRCHQLSPLELLPHATVTWIFASFFRSYPVPCSASGRAHGSRCNVPSHRDGDCAHRCNAIALPE